MLVNDALDPVYAVFLKQREYHTRELLSTKKRKLIRDRLKDGYSVEDLRTAIIGCHHTPHNCGQNERGTKYLGLHVSLRDENIQRFLETGLEVLKKQAGEKTEKRRRREARIQRLRDEHHAAQNMTDDQRQAELDDFRAARRAAGL